jgi:uncharacterized protein
MQQAIRAGCDEAPGAPPRTHGSWDVMSYVRVVNESRQRELGSKVRVAHSLYERMRGYLRRPPPRRGEGIFLAPCRSVHTWWMRYPVDVLLLDEEGRVVATYPEMPPGSITPIYRAAHFALELPKGAITESATKVGDRLTWKPAAQP